MKRQSKGHQRIANEVKDLSQKGTRVTPKIIGRSCRSYGIVESLDTEERVARVDWSQQIADDITREVSQQRVQPSFTRATALPTDFRKNSFTRRAWLPSPAIPRRI